MRQPPYQELKNANILPSALRCKVTIVIKALNEERHIAAAVESALHAVSSVGGEVVLADSCSTDRTLELASAFPIRVVQLQHAHERCCGIGPQLGYQHARGDYIYILDGDMQMLDGFLALAVAYMEAHPDVGGVGGRVVEMNTESLEYRRRVEKASEHMQAGSVDRLDMGGLYRRTAIEDAGYFSDRNLHSYEELDLAVRLRAKGWRLWRIQADAVRHHGHDAPPYSLLRRRWTSGYICGLGELVRASWGRPQMRLVLDAARELKLYTAVFCWALLVLSVSVWPVGPAAKGVSFLVIFLAPFLLMAWRKKSVSNGIYSVVSWLVNTLGLVRGMLRGRKPAAFSIASIIVSDQVSLRDE